MTIVGMAVFCSDADQQNLLIIVPKEAGSAAPTTSVPFPPGRDPEVPNWGSWSVGRPDSIVPGRVNKNSIVPVRVNINNLLNHVFSPSPIRTVMYILTFSANPPSTPYLSEWMYSSPVPPCTPRCPGRARRRWWGRRWRRWRSLPCRWTTPPCPWPPAHWASADWLALVWGKTATNHTF